MARWAPDAPKRLHAAAMELFAERGYDNTTAAEIAERSGLAKSGFFRHFADKREVLFFGQELLNGFLGEAIAAAPADLTPLAAVGSALEGLEVAFQPERREGARIRQVIIDAHPELRERELVKRAAMAEAMATALRRRAVPNPTARLAAEIGEIALNVAYTRWLASETDAPFGEFTREALDEFRAATAGLG
ncbi:TetR/AcrR family transcriptional regulator [Amycolatopsis pigmentata]|uniref:TetR/AcrR family transcriptional regulator n=1 Tax=Amycolatopsis pigmentata TaxID=450801 RepID=A0ABW5FMY4_9PSEU